jgi:hypothetical protein
MIQDVFAILIFGSPAAVIGYYILDHHKTLRERPFMRSMRGSREAAGTVLSSGLHVIGGIALVVCIVALALVIGFAVVKWALEKLDR